MSQESQKPGSEAQSLRLFCVPFSDKKTLLEIQDSLHKKFGVTGGNIIPISAGYTFNGSYLPDEAQFRLEFLVPFDKIMTILFPSSKTLSRRQVGMFLLFNQRMLH